MSSVLGGVPDPDSTRRRGVRSLWPWALLGLALVLWTFFGRAHGGLAEGELAPELRVPWSESEAPFDLAAQRGGVVVLAFWATWCPACRSEGPALSRVQRRLGNGESLVGVSVDTAPLDAITRAARGFGMTYPIAHASRADVDRFHVELLPTIVVIRPDGHVAASFAGTVGEERLMEAIASARRAP